MLAPLLAAGLAFAAPPGPGTGLNILIIVADDLGVDKVGSYASDADPDYASRASTIPQTPVLDQLSDAGVRFTDAWANPACSPTRAGLQTGQHAFRHGVGSPDDPELDLGATTLAHVAQDAGYKTALFGKWHLGEGDSPVGWTAGESWNDHLDEFVEVEIAPKALGWDTFIGTMGGIGSAGQNGYYDWTEVKSVRKWKNHSKPRSQTDYATATTTSKALNWIGNRTGPWLAVVNYHAPHFPLEAPPNDCGYTGDTSTNAEVFQAMTECLDQQIGELLDGIDDLSETVVIFVGDNGTKASMAEDVFDDGRGKGTVYESGVRVPLIITDGADWLEATIGTPAAGPGIVHTPGTTVTDPVMVLDLYATVASITGGDGSAGTDSVSLEWATRFGSMRNSRSAYTELYRETHGYAALRSGDYKLVVQANRTSGCREGYELYDLSTDRFEQTDLATSEPTILETLVQELDDLLATEPGSWLDLPDCS